VGIVAVVLAAGGGSRFAGSVPKLLATVRGQPVLRWAVQPAVEAGIGEVGVVTGAVGEDEASAALAGLTVTLVPNQEWHRGQATSLAAGIGWARARRADAIVVGLGDLLGVPSQAWAGVAAADGRPIAVATYGGIRGHPVRLARTVWDELPMAGDRGARDLMARRPELVAEVACAGDPTDIDTLEDLSRWS